MSTLTSIAAMNHRYSKMISEWHGLSCYRVGDLLKFNGFDQFNHMISINEIFSQSPAWNPVDRTGLVTSPIRYHVRRPWKVPDQQFDLDQALQRRVHNLLHTYDTINLFWSGGIDSTTMVTAFLKHTNDFSRLRILYSPWSTYEHPEYLKFLSTIGFPLQRIIDTSGATYNLMGTTYLDMILDGVFVSGDGGDELMASIDESFFEAHGYDTLMMPWKDFFYDINPDHDFIDFCQQHFAQAGRPIQTVLDARWWFYASCKNSSILNEQKLPYFLDYTNFNINMLHGFFDCEEFENFIYWNTHKIINQSGYHTWKQIFKDYCCELDGFEDWARTKSKFGSSQLIFYTQKKLILKNLRWLMILDDGTRISTPSLPFLNRVEYNSNHSKQLKHLFHEPSQL